MKKIVITLSYGKENPEMAHIAFTVAISALKVSNKVQVWLQGPSVNLCRIGYTEGVIFPPFPPIKQMIDDFRSAGGEIFLCSPCLKSHQIEETEYFLGPKQAEITSLIQESIGATVFNY